MLIFTWKALIICFSYASAIPAIPQQFVEASIYFKQGDKKSAYQYLEKEFESLSDDSLLGADARFDLSLMLTYAPNEWIKRPAYLYAWFCLEYLKKHPHGSTAFPIDSAARSRLLRIAADGSFEKADFNQATKYYRAIIEQFPKYSLEERAYATYKLGYVYLNGGKKKAALQLWQQFYQSNPHFELRDRFIREFARFWLDGDLQNITPFIKTELDRVHFFRAAQDYSSRNACLYLEFAPHDFLKINNEDVAACLSDLKKNKNYKISSTLRKKLLEPELAGDVLGLRAQVLDQCTDWSKIALEQFSIIDHSTSAQVTPDLDSKLETSLKKLEDIKCNLEITKLIQLIFQSEKLSTWALAQKDRQAFLARTIKRGLNWPENWLALWRNTDFAGWVIALVPDHVFQETLEQLFSFPLSQNQESPFNAAQVYLQKLAKNNINHALTLLDRWFEPSKTLEGAELWVKAVSQWNFDQEESKIRRQALEQIMNHPKPRDKKSVLALFTAHKRSDLVLAWLTYFQDELLANPKVFQWFIGEIASAQFEPFVGTGEAELALVKSLKQGMYLDLLTLNDKTFAPFSKLIAGIQKTKLGQELKFLAELKRLSQDPKIVLTDDRLIERKVLLLDRTQKKVKAFRWSQERLLIAKDELNQLLESWAQNFEASPREEMLGLANIIRGWKIES